jgi:hypothetical protein
VRHARHQFSHGRQAIGFHEANAHLAFARHVAAHQQHARGIGLGQAAHRERNDAPHGRAARLVLKGDLDSRRRALERRIERHLQLFAVRLHHEIDDGTSDNLQRIRPRDIPHGVVCFANTPALQHREHRVGRRAE